MIDVGKIERELGAVIEDCLMTIDPCIVERLERACAEEVVPNARFALEQIVRNAQLALEQRRFACQDTGVGWLSVTVGQFARLNGDLRMAIEGGVRLGYARARKSICHPLSRQNTEDNTPAVIYFDIDQSSDITIRFLAKGAGSENMSRVYMLTPAEGEQAIVNSVVDCVKRADSNPCPPLVIGVGVGGTMDYAALLSKRALFERGEEAALEARILAAVNGAGCGAQGMGGRHTALDVSVLTHPTHIGMLPVAVTLQCHASRHATIKFEDRPC